MLLRIPKGAHSPLSSNFNSYEFDCLCKSPTCTDTLVDEELIERLEEIREILNYPIKVTSGFRCNWHQTELAKEGLETSRAAKPPHTLGIAADIVCLSNVVTVDKLVAAAEQVGFTSIGKGKRFIHVDLRPEVRRWKYSY